MLKLCSIGLSVRQSFGRQSDMSRFSLPERVGPRDTMLGNSSSSGPRPYSHELYARVGRREEIDVDEIAKDS